MILSSQGRHSMQNVSDCELGRMTAAEETEHSHFSPPTVSLQ